MIRWETCQASFQYDGSLRDIYVSNVTALDWEKAYQVFLQYPGLVYSVDGVPQPPPRTVDEVLTCRSVREQAPQLQFQVQHATIVCHFFCPNEIECDLDPREIASQKDLDHLLQFIARLGDAVMKTVIVAPENCPAEPFITYNPARRQFY